MPRRNRRPRWRGPHPTTSFAIEAPTYAQMASDLVERGIRGPHILDPRPASSRSASRPGLPAIQPSTPRTAS